MMLRSVGRISSITFMLSSGLFVSRSVNTIKRHNPKFLLQVVVFARFSTAPYPSTSTAATDTGNNAHFTPHYGSITTLPEP